ncbi:MAG: hypothetical protein HKN58_01315 [Xanthomonadales bacterium]|nr:hypothetical protein [Xanthomonadales bacterium]
MINERTIELINGGLDGELNERQREELESALRESEGAQAFKAELEALDRVLAEQEPLDLPAGLHESTMSRISLPQPTFTWPRLAAIPGFMRYGLTAAAGLLLAVGLYEFRPGSLGEGEVENMVGTIMKGDRGTPNVTLDTFSFDLGELSSSVNLVQRDDALVLDVTLMSAEPIELTVDFTSDGLMFDAIAQMQSDLKSIEFADQAIQVTGHGQQHFAVLLHRDDAQPVNEEARIGLRFLSNGELVKEGTLSTRKP